MCARTPTGLAALRTCNARALAGVLCATALSASCSSSRPAAGPATLPETPGIAAPTFPDSITVGWALPPGAGNSTTRQLGDTVLHVDVTVYQAYALPSAQVGPSTPAARPMRLSVRAFARDTGRAQLRTLPIAYAACPFVLRLHRGHGRAGMPAWRSDAAGVRELACPPASHYSRGEVTVEWEVPAVLGDSLPAGHYAFSYSVRLADGRVFEFEEDEAYLTSDARPPTRDRSEIRMRARSEVVGQAPRMLRTTVAVVNTGRRTVQLDHGDCTPVVRIYRTAERAGQPIWRSERRTHPGDTIGYACIQILRMTVIAPNDSALLGLTVPLYEVLADSLPAGRYYVGAELELLNSELPSDRSETVYRLAAGAVDLTRAPDRLPATRTVDGLTYVGTTRLVRGAAPGADTVRTLVMITNTGRARATAEVPPDCPVIAYAYRSAELRDSIPLREPAWRPLARCYLYEHRFALEPGQSWVFGQDVLASEIVARSGPGRYWFTAVTGGRTRVVIAAGDVELGR
jgi:hypothetical protein